MSDEDKEHTRFVPGGLYRRRDSRHVCLGMLTGSVTKPNGMRSGTMFVEGEVSRVVQENSAALDEWTIIAMPVPVELADALEEIFFADGQGGLKISMSGEELKDTVASLRADLEEVKEELKSKLQTAPKETSVPEPGPEKKPPAVEKVSPTAAAAKTRARKVAGRTAGRTTKG